jgi:alpha-L-rhamnosidase
MRTITTLFLVLISFVATSFGQNTLTVTDLKCENKANPLGIENKNPKLNWVLKSTARDQVQTAYRILVADNQASLRLDIGNIWDSKKIISDNSILVSYNGRPLQAGKKYFWKVKVWNREGAESGWSKDATFGTGLYRTSDWSNAHWIGYERLKDSMLLVPGIHGNGDKAGKLALQRPVVPLFRKEFTIIKKIAYAQLFITGSGQYEASINGTKTGNSFLAPGWTDYDKTVLYNAYDVTAQLKPGKNTIGVIVGNGFHNINRERYRKLVITYGMPRMISKLKIVYLDGSEETIVSGADWKCAPSPITYTSIYGGEDYDARLEQKGWNTTGFDDAKWNTALLIESPKGKLQAETDYPLQVMETISMKKTTQQEKGKYLIDFGQNASGIVELKVQGKKGQVIKLTPGELITKDQQINQRASGSPYFLTYTLKGEGVETWRPRFTYYGFRYCMIEGAEPAKVVLLKKDTATNLALLIDLKFLHTRNASPQAGTFSCSNQQFNQTYDLINWAIRSNIQSVVTDCPHREKLGWLEQTYLMGASMFYNYNLYLLYDQTVKNMIDAQTANGLVPDIAPEYVHFDSGFRDSPEWGSAGVILPWMIYEWYGDKEVMKSAYPMMRKYVDYLGTKAKNYIVSHGLGDWYDLGPKFPGEAQLTPKAVTATSIYYYDLKLLSRMADILNNKEEATQLTVLSDEVKKSFNDQFFNAQTNIYSTGSQTAMSMPLCVGLVDENKRVEVLNNLVASINKSGKALTAGDIGFHFLVKALEEGGQSQLLYDMNYRNDIPGYGFQLKKGATSLTESWAALEEVSNNHLMLGHLMEWFYTGLGGIKQDPQSVAFKNIIIRPETVGDISQAKATYQSPYGVIKSEWMKKEGVFTLKVEVPVNTTATVYLPSTNTKSVTVDDKALTDQKAIQFIAIEKDKSLYKIGSGVYIFKCKM